ncbi:acyl carrier protein [Pseudomonas syringae]|uniref:acyl carrier protein n=1 Tax=Pseudomonas syringae TaxID=317 RepID=UPI0004660251|nr:acyl carrier protein [Pseudomonas syringae]AKF49755.1 Acyl carrier protein [Pseudomonas syringae pv. syringae HS191]MBI6561177.1 acyl carrier protein [Pseudomonas syringae]MBI6569639.1 acyl carrier protein [Pseudomonas syringae]MBI6588397.1 acyl carrier protein [Pseudomonas syringae]MBI6591628.1 acyl carrier protein [Pseudomonas syringae]
MKEKIKSYLTQNFLFEFDEDITEQDDLIKLGLIDSVGYIQLISFLKREFGIVFTQEDMMGNVLVSIQNMVEFVEKRATATR